MAKTKAELLNEYRELKKENLKLNNQLEHWKSIARKENDRVVDLATKLDECEKELSEWKDAADQRYDRIVDLTGELDEKTKELVKWVEAAKEYEETIARLCTDLDECEKEKTLIQSQRDVLLLDYENMSQEADNIKEDLEILQAQVRKIQINEEVTHDRAYEEGYNDAKRTYSQALQARESQVDSLIDQVDRLSWIIDQIHENQTK